MWFIFCNVRYFHIRTNQWKHLTVWVKRAANVANKIVNNVFRCSATLHCKLEVFRMLQRTRLHVTWCLYKWELNLHCWPTDKLYILLSLLSWNHIFVRKTISTVVQSTFGTMRRSYSLAIAYAMSPAKNNDSILK